MGNSTSYVEGILSFKNCKWNRWFDFQIADQAEINPFFEYGLVSLLLMDLRWKHFFDFVKSELYQINKQFFMFL